MTENKPLIVNLHEEGLFYGDISYQQITCDAIPSVEFSVCNLDECPEDAIIGRDLFIAEDYINTLRLGIWLASKGYTDIEVTSKE